MALLVHKSNPGHLSFVPILQTGTIDLCAEDQDKPIIDYRLSQLIHHTDSSIVMQTMPNTYWFFCKVEDPLLYFDLTQNKRPLAERLS